MKDKDNAFKIGHSCIMCMHVIAFMISGYIQWACSYQLAPSLGAGGLSWLEEV